MPLVSQFTDSLIFKQAAAMGSWMGGDAVEERTECKSTP